MKEYFIWLVDTLYEWAKYAYDLFLGEEGFVWYPIDFGIEVLEWCLDNIPDISPILDQYMGDSLFGSTAHAHQQSETVMFGAMSVQSNSGAFVMPSFNVMNAFFPLVEFGFLLIIFLLIMTWVLVGRYILKLIPGLGG